MKTFVRDVVVNILANLVAAGIIYLVGVAAGLFPQNGPAALMVGGILTCVIGAGAGGWVGGYRADARPRFPGLARFHVFGWMCFILYVAGATMAIFGASRVPGAGWVTEAVVSADFRTTGSAQASWVGRVGV